MPVAKKPEAESLSIQEIKTGELRFNILGTSPLVFNRMSEKARQQLLYPTGRKTAADKAAGLKHDPLQEYRDSVYYVSDDDENNPNPATRLVFPGAAFRKAVASAALDLPGLKKAQIGRLTWINEFNVSIFGVPQLYMAVVRSADMNKTPDIRTRAIVPKWACQVTVSYVKPLTKPQQLMNLMGAAGILIGIGDGRQEKGALSNGQFEVVNDGNENFSALLKNAGKKAQDTALGEPSFFDTESHDLFNWFYDEVEKREGGETAQIRRAA